MTPPNIQALDTAEDQIQRDDILVENWQRAVRFGYALTAKVIVDAYVAGYSPSQICVVLGLCSYQVTRLLGYGLLVRKWQAIGLSEDIMPTEYRVRGYLSAARDVVSRESGVAVNKVSTTPGLMDKVIEHAIAAIEERPLEGELYASGQEFLQPPKHAKTLEAEAASLGARTYKRCKGLADHLTTISEQKGGTAGFIEGCATSYDESKSDRQLCYWALKKLHRLTGEMLTEIHHTSPELAPSKGGGRIP